MKQQTTKKMTISVNRKIDGRKKIWEVEGDKWKALKGKWQIGKEKKVKMSRSDSYQVKNKWDGERVYWAGIYGIKNILNFAVTARKVR